VTATDVVETEELSTGLTGDAELDAPDGVRAVRITWIDWDSDFRAADLRIGDRVIAVDGVALADQLLPGKFGNLVGQANESLGWQTAGAQAGQTVTLTVLRGEEQLEVAAKLLAERLYRQGDKPALAPGGPVRLENDGFDGPWMSWYENFVKRMSYVLDYAWVRTVFDNRAALAEHDEWLPRIEYVEQHHPGDFARILRADWEAVRAYLAGAPVDAVDLEYRDLGAKRLEQVRAAAVAGHAELTAALADRIIDAFPVPTLEQHAAAVGKVVELPVVQEREIVNDLGQTYAVAASPTGEYYLVLLSGNPAVRALYATTERFRGNVNPSLAERHQYIGAISEQRRMITFRDRPIVGVLVDVIAARVGADGECFVDMREPPGDAGFTFAGEAALRSLAAAAPSADAPPEAVLTTMVDAVKTADRARFDQLFATWSAGTYDGQAYYNAAYRQAPAAMNGAWERSREMITGDVYDVRVASIGRVRRVVEPDPATMRPAIDQVVCFIDHVGSFDGEYRTFMTSFVHRRWVLQRLDEGPWRITEAQSL
jgi:hypothetical protein